MTGVPRIEDWNRLLDGRVAVVTGGGPDETADVLVAGSEGGIAGAYTAAREELSVALVEAGNQVGGTGAAWTTPMWMSTDASPPR
jgi:ribulose 1,5-bisphosphate synthetase/thiazole synthase